MGGEFTYQPKWDPKTVLTHSQIARDNARKADPLLPFVGLMYSEAFLYGAIRSNQRAWTDAEQLGSVQSFVRTGRSPSISGEGGEYDISPHSDWLTLWNHATP